LLPILEEGVHRTSIDTADTDVYLNKHGTHHQDATIRGTLLLAGTQD